MATALAPAGCLPCGAAGGSAAFHMQIRSVQSSCPPPMETLELLEFDRGAVDRDISLFSVSSLGD